MSIVRDTSDPDLVQLIQLGLEYEGLYEGELDGIYGPATETAFQAWRRFQRYEDILSLTKTLSADQMADLAKFIKGWKLNQGRYASVAVGANVPAELVAALHWRESGGDFTTYLCNGDPLGAPTVHVPKGILFQAWEPAAIDALTRESNAREWSGIEEWTTNLECMCVYAEAFNGEGYAEMHPPVPDPYVLAGMSGYTAGKYVADGVYDPHAVDTQLGVLVMLRAVLP
jgi:lysozyme family protein